MAQKLSPRQTLGDIKRRLMTQPTTTIPTASGTPAALDVLAANTRFLHQVMDVTDTMTQNELAVQKEQSDVARLEVETRKDELLDSREDRVTARERKRKLDEEEQQARIDNLRNPQRAGGDIVPMLLEQVTSLQRSAAAQSEQALLGKINDLERSIKDGNGGPTALIAQIDAVLAIGDKLRGVAAPAERHETDLRAQALQIQQQRELANDRHARELEERRLDDEREEAEHRRDMEKRRADQLDGFLQALGPLAERILGNATSSAAPAQPQLNAPAAPPPPPAPGVLQTVCPVPGCGASILYHESSRVITCQSCGTTLEMRDDDERADPPMPPPALDLPIVMRPDQAPPGMYRRLE